ncbi:MAG: CotH kinase family protein [Lachnospiraceae bacterium]|nr:CotH kinase family protein [Lachnospiraceae bacterium]
MNRRIVRISCILMLGLAALTGCGAAPETDASSETPSQTESRAEAVGDAPAHQQVVFAEEEKKGLSDNFSLYEDRDPAAVKTLYLTVTSGNASDGTNHTWEEVNTYNNRYYEDRGIERYRVEGLLQEGDETGPVEGAYGYGLYTPNCTVSIRGQTSTELERKNYKIRIDKGSPKYDDQRVINLNKHLSDGLRFRNKLMFDLLVGVPDLMSFRTEFVHLYVNDLTDGTDEGFADYGLYTQVEQPNDSYLRHHGLDENGQLYKLNELFEFFPYEEAIKLKSDADYDLEAFEYHLAIQGNDDHEKLITMLRELNDETVPIHTIIDKWFDADNIAMFLAFNILTGNVDTQSRNTLLYSAKNENTWYVFNWDCDTAFRDVENAITRNEQPRSLSWENGISNYWGNVLYRRFLQDAGYRALLDEKIHILMEDYLSEERIRNLIELYTPVAKPYAYADRDVTYAPLLPEEYDSVVSSIIPSIADNYEMYLESLQRPMPFYLDTPEPRDSTTYFDWDASYDLDADLVTYRFELSQDKEFTDPLLTAETFRPEYELGEKLAPGSYYYRVKAVDDKGYEQYAFDYLDQNGVKFFGMIHFYVMPDGSIYRAGE